MTATSKPAPGSRAVVLDAVVRAVTEGRYRYAQLLLLWHRDRVPPEEMAELVTSATAAEAFPPGITPAEVIARSKPHIVPDWLDHQIDNEIHRIFARQPVAGASPVQLVARVVAAVCIDVSVDTMDAATRSPDDLEATTPTPRNRLIHLGAPDTIDLDAPPVPEAGPLLPPPPR